MSYTKLFNSIITSTIWSEDDQTRIIWITLLALADQNGEVQASIPGLARLSGVSVEATETAIIKFMEPDKYSRTKDDEGRRLEEIEGGWALINHAKYRRMASKDDSKEKNAERQKRFRERSKRNASVTHSNASVTQERDIAEAEAEAEADSNPKKKTPPKSPKGECEGKPTLIEFESYLMESLPKINPDWTPERIKRAANLQYETFIEDGWRDGNGKVVKNWKTKTRNIMSYKSPWRYGGDTRTKSQNQPRQTLAELTAGKSSDINNASELNLEQTAYHE